MPPEDFRNAKHGGFPTLGRSGPASRVRHAIVNRDTFCTLIHFAFLATPHTQFTPRLTTTFIYPWTRTLYSCSYLGYSLPFFRAMFLGAKRPPPNIRRVSRPVQQADQRKQGAPGSTNGKPSLNISNPPKKPSDKNSKSLKPSLASRSGPTPSSLAPRQRSRKRKAPSPTTITHQQFSSDSEDDEDDEEAQLHSTKRSRTSPRRDALSPDFQRKTFDLRTWTADDDKAWPIRQGADLTAGEYAKEYRTVFETGADGAFVDLKYPSNCPTER